MLPNKVLDGLSTRVLVARGKELLYHKVGNARPKISDKNPNVTKGDQSLFDPKYTS